MYILKTLFIFTVIVGITLPTLAKDGLDPYYDQDGHFKSTIEQNHGGIWKIKSKMPTARDRLGVVSFQGKIYAMGGTTNTGCCGYASSLPTSKVEIYDPATDTWEIKTDMPKNLSEFGVCSMNKKIYILGGGDGYYASNGVYAYNPISNKWTTLPPMPSERRNHRAICLNNKIYVIGGQGCCFSHANGKVDVYDIKNHRWDTTLTSMPTGRFHFASGVFNKMIYAISGGDSMRYYSTVEHYDPKIDVWYSDQDAPIAPWGASASVISGKIYLMGSGNNYTNSVYQYSPNSNAWATMNPMFTRRGYAGSAVIKGKIYVIGGRDSDVILSKVEEYTPPR